MSPTIWLARHAQTLVGSLGRLARYPLASAMTMGVIGVALSLPIFLDIVVQDVRAATATWNRGLDISVFMDKKAGASRTTALAKSLRTRADVAAVRVISADEALAQFRDWSGFGNAVDALRDNPLPDTLVITPTPAASTPAAMQALERSIAGTPDVQGVQIDQEWVERLHGMIDVTNRIIAILGGLLGIGIVLVVANTIRLDILNRRTEIEVMKLVGASDSFTRRPFLYSGAWYGMGGAVFAMLAVVLALRLLGGPVDRLAGLYGSEFHLGGLPWRVALASLGSATGFGWLGSWVAATRQIRGIEPS